MDLCPCGSNVAYTACCKPVIKGERPALTAEQLMRSRYSAYVEKEIDYILTSLHPEHRKDYDEKSSRDWAESAQWHGIKILNTVKGTEADTEGEVEFSVSFSQSGLRQEHHERSTFKKEGATWYFVEGKTMPKPVFRATPKTGRNEPCHCGSGKKFKKCCGMNAA